MAEQDFSLNLTPFVIPRSEANRVKEIQERHEKLLRQSEVLKTQDIDQIIDFLKYVEQSGALIKHSEYRSQLRALIRYWLSFLGDKVDILPAIQLLPFNSSQLQDIRPKDITKALKASDDAREIQDIHRYKKMIGNMYSVLLYGMDLRTITKSDIDMFERDLRDIIKGIENLRRAPYIFSLLSSVDAVQEKLKNAVNSLYLASYALEQGGNAVRGRKLLYQTLQDCERFLQETLEQFLV